MRRNAHKKGIIFVTFILIISLINLTFGLWNQSFSTAISTSKDIISDKPSYSSEGKPDFIIEDIFLWPSDFPNKYHFEYRLKNIGDTPIYNFRQITTIQIRWLIFSNIPLFIISSKNIDVGIGALLPGDAINIGFISCDSLPKFGSYRFTLTVNPNKTIDESNYDNNKYSEDWTVFLGQWKPLK